LKLEGILPPHITPFLENEELDENALRSLVHFWLDSGCNGLVSCASTGEAPYMTREERRKVLKTVLDEVNGKAPIIAGVGAPSTRETITFARDAVDIGADGLIVVAPYFFKPDGRELFEHYSNVMNSTSVPVVIYNVPKFTGYNLEPKLIVKLTEQFSHVVGVKDSSGSISQIATLTNRVHSGVSILAGTADLVLPSLLMGAKGAVVADANVAPRLCVDVYVNFKRNDLERARRAQMRLLELNDLLVKSFNQISTVKEAMNQLGKSAGYPRGPSLPLDDTARSLVREKLASLDIH
jgi:4-hydroxy-tetrahydrodipicolinate synthase